MLLLGAGSRSWAQEAIAQEAPTPSSVHEVLTPIERSCVDKPARVSRWPWLQEQVNAAPPFFRDTQLEVNLHTYYFYRDKFREGFGREISRTAQTSPRMAQ